MLSLIKNNGGRNSTSKNHKIPRIIKKITQKLIKKNSMSDIAHQLAISTSTVIRKLNDFRFKHDFSRLPEIMSWDDSFTKGKMSFIAQDFNKLNVITVLEERTQSIIRNHFLRYNRTIPYQMKVITMDWKLIQQDSRKISDKRFYRPTL